jgi:predicted MPP superfamily phosphohydrolase
MNLRFFTFIVTISSLFLSSGFYLGSRISVAFPEYDTLLLWLAVFAVIILQIAGPLFYRVLPDHNNRYFVLRWIMFMCMGIASSALLYMMATDFIVFGLKILLPAHQHIYPQVGVAAAISLVLLTNIVGMAQVAHGPRLYHVKVPLPKAYNFLHGLRIAQISDLHVGPTIGRRYAQRVVNLVNGQKPDLIALTGDIVDGRPDQLRQGIEPLRNLVAKYGTFSVLGNHEFYWNAQSWMDTYRALGMSLLNNSHQIISHNDSKFLIAGVPDRKASRMLDNLSSSPSQALDGAPGDMFKILLAHQPSSHDDAEKAGFHLQLSGHTHGGQFFPFTLIVRLAEKFIKGLYQHKGLWVYVNRGTGYWGPPIRFLVPAEVTIISLHYDGQV